VLKVYDAENQIDAQLALDALQSADIEVVMKGQFLSGAAGELPRVSLPCGWWIRILKVRQEISLQTMKVESIFPGRHKNARDVVK